MKKSLQKLTTLSAIIALLLLAPVANAEEKGDKDSGGDSNSAEGSSASGGKSGASTPAGTPQTNTIIIGGPAGSMSVNSAVGSAPVTSNVVQEQTITSPYNYR